MSEPTTCARARSRSDSCSDSSSGTCSESAYYDRCDLLVGLEGFHILEGAEREGKRGTVLRVVVESAARIEGLRLVWVVAHSHGRRNMILVDTRALAGGPADLAGSVTGGRRAGVPDGSFTEQHDDLVRPRALLTVRACWWAIRQGWST